LKRIPGLSWNLKSNLSGGIIDAWFIADYLTRRGKAKWISSF